MAPPEAARQRILAQARQGAQREVAGGCVHDIDRIEQAFRRLAGNQRACAAHLFARLPSRTLQRAVHEDKRE
jgi:hypothetical protein